MFADFTTTERYNFTCQIMYGKNDPVIKKVLIVFIGKSQFFQEFKTVAGIFDLLNQIISLFRGKAQLKFFNCRFKVTTLFKIGHGYMFAVLLLK